MLDLETDLGISLKNVLYLTDFSESSEAALPIALGIAQKYNAKVCTLHVILPDPYAYATPDAAQSVIQASQEAAKEQMRQIEAKLTGIPQETITVRAPAVWPSVEFAIARYQIDLLVIGTRGRTGLSQHVMGSVAEVIFRCSPVPVMTVGPGVPRSEERAIHLRRVLYATDFTPDSLAAGRYAVSIAQENEGQLILLHVVPHYDQGSKPPEERLSVAEAIHRLDAVVPSSARLRRRPETSIAHGDPAKNILETAHARAADLIVLGIHRTKHLLAATHLHATTAHKIVACAECPVLTVRPQG